MAKTKNRMFIKVLSVLFALFSVISAFSFSTIDAQAANRWTTGCFAGSRYTYGTRADLKNKKQNATIKLHVYKKNSKGIGKSCKSNIDIMMKDSNGNIIWQGTKVVGKSGLTLKLGKDHSRYVLYFRVHSGKLTPKDMDYVTPDYWGIEYTKNCS